MDIVERLGRLVIMDEVGSDNPLARDAIAEITRLRDALRFYADEWKRSEHPFGLAGPDMTPTHKLICDYGETARTALGERE